MVLPNLQHTVTKKSQGCPTWRNATLRSRNHLRPSIVLLRRLRRLDHPHYFATAFSAAPGQHQGALFLHAPEFDHLHRTPALRTETVLQNPPLSLLRNRAPKNRRLRGKWLFLHPEDYTTEEAAKKCEPRISTCLLLRPGPQLLATNPSRTVSRYENTIPFSSTQLNVLCPQ